MHNNPIDTVLAFTKGKSLSVHLNSEYMQPMNGLLVSCLVLIYLVTLFHFRSISTYFVNVCFCISFLAAIHMPLSSVIIITIMTFWYLGLNLPPF